MADIVKESAVIKIAEIFADPKNNFCRKNVNYTTVADLAEAIKEAGQLFQPICVTPYDKNGFKYRLISGFRRHMACKFLKWEEIPATIFTGMSEEQIAYMNLSENLDRKNLNILEEAFAIRQLAFYGFNANQIAKKVHRSNMWVMVRLALLTMPEEVQSRAETGLLNQEEILTLSKQYKRVMNGTLPEEDFYQILADTTDFRLKASKKNAVAATKTFQKEFGAESKKTVRTQTEIGAMQGILLKLFGTNLGSRAIAWATCQISGKVFLECVKKEAELYQIDFKIPAEYDDPSR